MVFRTALFAISTGMTMTAAHAADPGVSVGMLGSHPAVVAHLLAMPAPVVADPAPHPAVIAHLRMLGGAVDPSAAPKVHTAFTHRDRLLPRQAR